MKSISPLPSKIKIYLKISLFFFAIIPSPTISASSQLSQSQGTPSGTTFFLNPDFEEEHKHATKHTGDGEGNSVSPDAHNFAFYADQDLPSVSESTESTPVPQLLSDNTESIKQLTIPELVELVVKKNEQILSQKMAWLIKKEEVKGSWAIFEPEFVESYQNQYNLQRNTIEESVSRQLTDIYEQKNELYSIGIEGLVPTGAKLNLNYTRQDLSNTLTRQDPVHDPQYRVLAGATIVQPILKNAGIKTTMARIRVAESDYATSFQAYRQEMMTVVANAIIAYWDLYFFQELLTLRNDSVRIAQYILEDNQARFKSGKMAEVEIFEAETGLASRQSLENEAMQNYVSAMNNLRSTFSSVSTGKGDDTITTVEKVIRENINLSQEQSLKTAFSLRPEYLSSRQKIEREKIRIAFTENQLWPQLDLKASYGLNGLGASLGSAFNEMSDGDFNSYSIGVEIRFPLFGGKKNRSELAAMKLNKSRALLEMKSIEVGLANAIDTAIKNVHNTAIQEKFAAKIVDLKKRLLDVEMARREAGKSHSRLILEKEEEYTNAKEEELNKLVNYQKAILGLKYQEGSLLAQYRVDIIKEEL